MEQLVLDPAAARAAGESRVGGKAAGLARLQAAGAAVPPWFVVAADALGAHLEAAGLRAEVATTLRELAALPADAPDTRARLEAAAARLRRGWPRSRPPRPRGVRDGGPRRARAGPLRGPQLDGRRGRGDPLVRRGQLDSFLYRRDAAEVLEAVSRCWASAFSPRALAYRRGAGAGDEVPAVGVVVQRMLTGRVSGVLFTTDPVSGRGDLLRVSACWGLCDGVVNGACNADEFVIDAPGSRSRPGSRPRTCRWWPPRTGRHARDRGRGRPRDVRCLQPAELTRLGAAARQLAQAARRPARHGVDDRGDAIWFLQARPSPRRARRPAPPRPRRTRAPGGRGRGPARGVGQQQHPGELLRGDDAPHLLVRARRLRHRLRAVPPRRGVTEDVIEQYHPVFRQLLGLVRRPRLLQHQQLVPAAPRAARLRPQQARHGADDGARPPRRLRRGPGARAAREARRLPRLAWTGLTLKARFLRLEHDVARFLADFEAAYRSVDRRAFATMSLSELMATRARLHDEILGNWHTPIINDLYVMQASGNLRRLVERAVGIAARRGS